jgi:hypothetical protein
MEAIFLSGDGWPDGSAPRHSRRVVRDAEEEKAVARKLLIKELRRRR